MIQVRREIKQLGILFYSIFYFPTKVGGDHVHKLQLGKIPCPPPLMTALYLFGESFDNFLKIMFFVGRMQRKVLHRFVMMAKRTMPSSMGDQLDSGEDKAAQEGQQCRSVF